MEIMTHFGKNNINEWMDQLMAYPGIDEEMIILKKNVWLGSIGTTIAVSGMTILGWALDLPTIVAYGIILLIATIPTIFIIPFMKKHVDGYILAYNFH